MGLPFLNNSGTSSGNSSFFDNFGVAPSDPGVAAARSSHLGFGSMGGGALSGTPVAPAAGVGATTLPGGGGGLVGPIASAVQGALANAMEGGGSPHPQILDVAPRVRGEEVRMSQWLGLHGAEMRAMAKGRFDRSDTAGTGRSGANGNAPPAYIPTPGAGSVGGPLPFTMPTMGGRREQGAPVRPRAARPVRDVTDVSNALPRTRARRGNKPTGI